MSSRKGAAKMKIGEFVKVCGTTKDTVRHYEDLALIHPIKPSFYKIYGQRELDDFRTIKEMQSLGLSLKTVKKLFEMKSENGCGSQMLIDHVSKELLIQQVALEAEETKIRKKRKAIETLIAEIQRMNNQNF